MATTLDVYLSTNARPTHVTFATEAQALAFLDRPSVAKAEERDDSVIPNEWVTLIKRLYPTCDHGLSLDLCDGPQHYPYGPDEPFYF